MFRDPNKSTWRISKCWDFLLEKDLYIPKSSSDNLLAIINLMLQLGIPWFIWQCRMSISSYGLFAAGSSRNYHQLLGPVAWNFDQDGPKKNMGFQANKHRTWNSTLKHILHIMIWQFLHQNNSTTWSTFQKKSSESICRMSFRMKSFLGLAVAPLVAAYNCPSSASSVHASCKAFATIFLVSTFGMRHLPVVQPALLVFDSNENRWLGWNIQF